MSLADCLNCLFRFLEQAGVVPPSRDVRIVEIGPTTPVDEKGRFCLAPRAPQDPLLYGARFEELQSLGLPWINVSCYGVMGAHLIVVVEVPAAPSGRSPRTSINYSGPSKAVLRNGWDAGVVLALA